MKFKKKSIFQIVISILFLLFLFFIVKPEKIWEALNQANLKYVVLAFALLPLNMLFQFLRWRYLVKEHNQTVGNMEILKSIFYSYSYSIFTPARLGDVGRAFHISHQNRKEIISLAIYEKVFASLSIIIVGVISLGIYKNSIYLIAALALILLMFFLRNIINKFPYLRDHLPMMNNHSPTTFFIICIMFVFIYIYQFFLLIYAFKPISLIKSFFRVFLIILANSAPITVNGLGVREVLAVYFFKPLGVDPAQAASASLLLFTINILIPTIIGFILHLSPNKTKSTSLAKE